MVRSLVIFGIVVFALVGLAALAIYAYFRIENRLVVENQSGQPIASLKITVGGRTIVFENVQSGSKESSRFFIGGGDHFVVAGQLADGTRIKGDFSYVTTGMYGEHARFVVQPGGKIQFRQRLKADQPE